MAFKPSQPEFNPKNLLSNLTSARIQDSNNALYQTIYSLINGLGTFKEQLDAKLNSKDKINLASQVEGMLSYYNGGALTGIYIPVLDNVANITSSASYYTPWFRIGNIIHVSGKVTIETTASATLTQLELVLPVASKFAHEDECSGVANGVPFSGSTDNFAGIVKANPVNGNAVIHFYSTNTVNNDVRFEFTYRFIPK
jgi:hypothetical protein